MIIAELQGKIPSRLENKEDILTSNVFSFFKYSDRRLFKEYLNEFGLEVSIHDAQNAEFQFWLNYDDGTQPDLVVQCGRYYILFEAKLYSDFGPKSETIEAQIDREIKMGKLSAENEDLEFVFVAITAEYFKDMVKYSKYENKDHLFFWTNWQTVTNFIESRIESKTPIRDFEFATDLHALLLRKRLRSFKGLSNLNSQLIESSPTSVFYNVGSSKFKGEFTGFSEVLSEFPEITSYVRTYEKSYFLNLPDFQYIHLDKIYYHESTFKQI